jgi:hypothetical protein
VGTVSTGLTLVVFLGTTSEIDVIDNFGVPVRGSFEFLPLSGVQAKGYERRQFRFITQCVMVLKSAMYNANFGSPHSV